MAIQKYKGHLALLGAAIMWGLMSPIGKTALENGISGLSLATFRMTGGAICFWIASIFAPKEQVKPHDLMMLFFAGLLGIVLNQGCFTFGLSLTSPIDASIVTTTAPIATMIVAAIYLKEPVTGKKVIGIFLGSIGALTLIVIVGGTFLAYILMMIGQKTLRPTVISMYNYVQPIVGTSVSILLGMGTFGVAKGIAVALVFTGVYIVTQSKSREQMLAEQAAKKE